MRPAWDSAPTRDPKPPSKFWQDCTKLATLSVSTLASLPSRDSVATAQKQNLHRQGSVWAGGRAATHLLSTSPHLSPVKLPSSCCKD